MELQVHGLDSDLSVRGSLEADKAPRILLEKLVSGLADADPSRDPVGLDPVRDKDVLTKNVVVDNLGSNDSSDEFPGVDPDSHRKPLHVGVRRVLSLFVDNLAHVEARLDELVGFLYLDAQRSSLFVGATRVAHDHVAVTDRVHFIDVQLLAHQIELAEDP